jgi:uncharacterized protein with FMN-binding domain
LIYQIHKEFSMNRIPISRFDAQSPVSKPTRRPPEFKIPILKRILLAGFLMIAVTLLSGCAFIEMSDYAKNAVIKTPDLSLIPDGVYTGSAASGIVSATVELEIKDHAILAFRLLKQKHGPGHSAESLLPIVIEKQSLEVDAVSGATVSSKVVLKAAEMALKSALSE